MIQRLDDVAAQATAQSLDAMLAELEALPASPARTLGLDAIDALLQLHGEGFARVVAAYRDERLSDDFLLQDAVVSQLLAIHDVVQDPSPVTLVQLERRHPNGAFDDADLVPALREAHAACQLCSEPIGSDHRHLLDLERHELLCACTACTLSLGEHATGAGRYQLVPRRYHSLDRSLLDNGLWERLELPVDVAFMFLSSRTRQPVAFYPGPMGTTESSLSLPAWSEVVARSPVLSTLAPDVEAILVRRARGAREYWLVPVDECYRLAGAMRATWEGISGGDAMRAAVDAFFLRLSARASVPDTLQEAS